MKRVFIFLFACISFLSFGQAGDKLEIASLRSMADSLHNIGKSDSAIIIGERAIALSEKIHDKVLIMGSLAGQGVYLRSVGRIDEALKSYGKAMEIATSPEFRSYPSQEAVEEIASLYINMAVLDLDMQHKEEAVTNALKAGEWCEKSRDSEFKATVFGVVGSVLTGCGKLEDAGKFQGMAFSNAKESGDVEASFRAAAYAMLISNRTGDYKKEEEWRAVCNDMFQSVESLMARLVYYQAECSISLKKNDKKGALVWFNKIVNTNGIDNLPFVKFDAYNNMHLAYADLGEYEKAYRSLLKGNELRDTLFEREKGESLRDLTVKYQTKETELALAQSESKKSKILMWLFISLGIILTGAILFILYFSRQKRLRMEKEIEYARMQGEISNELTRQYLEGLESERKRIAGELHDGVCNDLLAIEIGIRNRQSITEAERQIERCRASVRRISHEMMPPEFAYASLDEVTRHFIKKQQEANGENIAFKYDSFSDDGGWSNINNELALEIYRIVQEGVGNAVKHSGADKISVRLAKREGILTLEINDNGKFKKSDKRGSVLASVRRRSNLIKGEVKLSVSEECGTTIALRVKTEK